MRRLRVLWFRTGRVVRERWFLKVILISTQEIGRD